MGNREQGMGNREQEIGEMGWWGDGTKPQPLGKWYRLGKLANRLRFASGLLGRNFDREWVSAHFFCCEVVFL